MSASSANAGPPASLPLLQLREVSKRFGGVAALDGVDFDVRAGEVHGIIGENGAGKSTMMKLLSGVYGDYTGEMRVEDRPVRFSSPADAQARGIGMVYQELSAFPHLTVAENIFGRQPPLRHGFVDWKAMHQGAKRHLSDLGLDIDVDVDVAMAGLPVGNQQLIEIARVIFSGARLIILDEPTSALSPPETRRLFDFMTTLRAQGKTVIFISHFLEDVLEVTDRITVLKNSRNVAVVKTGETNKDRLVELMIGTAPLRGHAREAREAEKDTTAPRATVLLAEGLSRRGAFRDISFRLDQGEILGLYAFMGAGQTQLGRCLFGAERLDAGTTTLAGEKIVLRNTTHARVAGIAFVPENRRDSLMLDQEVFKNITLAHLGRLVGRWLFRVTEHRIAREQIARLGVRPSDPLLPVGALSGGNQQKVVLAKWLTQQPRVLILNEPTRGMDVGAKDEVIAIVKRLRAEGVAILLITTEPETIAGVADRALVMRKGRLTVELRGATLTKENLIKHA